MMDNSRYRKRTELSLPQKCRAIGTCFDDILIDLQV